MKVSVCVPTVGREYAYDTFRSLSKQTVKPHEVVIVNQGETPFENLEAFGIPIRQIMSPEKGLSRARNVALNEFTGDWIVFIDDDEEANAEWIEQIQKLAQAYPEAGIIGGSYYPPIRHDDSASFVSRLYPHGDTLLTAENLFAPTEIPDFFLDVWGGNFAVRKDVVEAIGGFDVAMGRGSKAFNGGEDTDYLIRAVTKGFAALTSCRVVIYHTHGARPHSPDLEKELIEMATLLRWKSEQDPSTHSPAITSRLVPYGKKKAAVAALCRGVLFNDQLWRKEAHDKMLETLNREWKLENGCLVRK
jgi:glycosyltransferase involved in cell wall biosynthesis